MDFPTLAKQCAPDVHITTLAAVVRHESAFDPLVIGVNAKPHRNIRPKSRDEAIQEVKKLMDQGADFDVGYGQINVRNWKWLGVTPETILDPCTNLASAQRVLVACYQKATQAYGAGQPALYAAFSCYNTGNLTGGFKNGYVGAVLAGAGLAVPAIAKDGPAKSAPAPKQFTSAAAPAKPAATDALAAPRGDAFGNTRNDVFNRDQAAVFGSPVPMRVLFSR